ncbi:MAG: hypothetical protein JW820_17960, partial [Spirochaetales bacterium]|nr:hypothetical protein [Spirochaetales bacterium]
SAMEKLDLFVRTYSWFLDEYPLYRDLYRPGNDLLPRWLKSRHSKDLFAEIVETLRAIIEEGREEGIFRQDMDPERSALVLCQLITVGLGFDPGVYSRRDRAPYAVHLDTLLGIIARGLVVPD